MLNFSFASFKTDSRKSVSGVSRSFNGIERTCAYAKCLTMGTMDVHPGTLWDATRIFQLPEDSRAGREGGGDYTGNRDCVDCTIARIAF